jgi:hypothetical protein
MPRPMKSRRRRGPPSDPRRPRPTSSVDPAAPLRSLIREGLITAAALGASDDLSAAAASLERFGTLTSGMWRALARELATASERLDRQTQERLDSLQQKARALDADPDAVIAAGMAAEHLDEHRETLANLLRTLDPDVSRLAAPDVLVGFTADEEGLLDDEPQAGDTAEDAAAASDADDDAPLAVHIRLFLWPAPLTPADIRLAPDLAERTLSELPVQLQVEADDALLEALSTTCELPRERLLSTLSTLAVACWSAHRSDERGGEEQDESEGEENIDAAAEEDDEH